MDESAINKHRIYVGARSAMREQAAACAKLLRSYGFEVTSDWHDDPRFAPNLAQGVGDHDITAEANRDEAAIRRSTHMVRLSDGDPGTGGNLVEWGLARAYGVVQILVGPEVNIFDRDTCVIHAEAGEDLIAKIRA